MTSNTVSQRNIPDASQRETRLASNGCRLCDSPETTPFLTFKGRELAKCTRCSFVYMNPQPTDAELGEIYGADYFLGSTNEKGRAATEALKRASARHYLSLIPASIRPAAGASGQRTLLEVGPGGGELLVEAGLAGWSVAGVEYSPDACKNIEAALRKNIPASSFAVHCGELEAVGFPDGSFDACVLSDVIEHVRDPRRFLAEVFRLLKPGGAIVVATPSLDSFSAKLMGRHWMEYKEEHLLYFNRETLKRSLQNAGFRNVELHPGKKTLSLEYVVHHFDRFKVPLVTPALNMMLPLIPKAVREKPRQIVASGIIAIGVK